VTKYFKKKKNDHGMRGLDVDGLRDNRGVVKSKVGAPRPCFPHVLLDLIEIYVSKLAYLGSVLAGLRLLRNLIAAEIRACENLLVAKNSKRENSR
jgi:hypothetical protein